MAGTVGVAFVDILGDTSRAPQQIERDMNRALVAVSEAIDPVSVQAAVEAGTDADLTSEINADLRSVNAAIDRVRVQADLDPDTRRRLQQQLRETAASLRAARSEIQVRVAERPIVEQVVAAVEEAVVVAEAVAPPIEIETRVDSDRLTRALTSVGTAARGALGPVSAVGVAVAGFGTAVPALASVAGLLASMAPAAALIAPAIATGALAMGTFKIATFGVADAIKTAFDPSDAKKFAESLKALSPEARKFVTAIHDAAPALVDIRKQVQDRFFQGLTGDLKELSSSALPSVKAALLDAGSSFNTMARGVLQTGTALSDSGVLGKALTSAQNSLRSLVGLPGQAANAFGLLAAAAGPSLEKIATKAAGVGDTLTGKINKAFESGGLQKAIDQAITVLGQLGTVASNVFSIVGSVFSAAQTGGGGLINTLVTVTGALKTAFADPKIVGGLQALFSAMGQLSTAAVSLLGPALGVVAQVVQALLPGVTVLIGALQAGLQPIIAALGPVLLSAAQAVTQFVVAFSPLLPVIGLLISQGLALLTPILDAVSLEFQQLAPLISQLATVISAVLGPVLGALPGLLQPFISLSTQLVSMILPLLTSLLVQLQPSLVQLSTSFVQIATALAPVLTALVTLAVQCLQPLLPLLPPIIGFVAQLASILAGQLASFINNFVVPALKSVAALLRGDFRDAFRNAMDATKGFATELLKIFIRLPYDIVLALGDLTGTLLRAGTDLIAGLIRGIKNKLGDLKDLLSNVTDLIPDWKGPMSVDRVLLVDTGEAIMGGLVMGLDRGTPALQSKLQGITRMIGGTGAGIAGVSFGSATGGMSAAARFAGAAPAFVPQQQPIINQVFLGTEQITDILDSRIARQQRASDRRAMIGSRG